MNDKELIIALLKDGISPRDVSKKFEMPIEEVYKIWNAEKERTIKMFSDHIAISDLNGRSSLGKISDPIGVTSHNLVTHVIMDLDHYLGLTNAEAKPE